MNTNRTRPIQSALKRRSLIASATIAGLTLTLAACGGSIKAATAVPAAAATNIAPAASSSTASAASPSTQPTGNSAAATNQPGSRANGGTRGTIESITGEKVVLNEPNGTKVNVLANGTTAVSVSKPASLADFKVGDNIMVVGTADANGTVAATAVSSGRAGNAPRPANANAPASTGTNGANANGQRPGSGIRGSIVSVAGTQLVINDTTGKAVNVSTSAATTFTVSRSGSVADYKVGDVIVVQGTPDATGSIVAASISPSPARGNFGGAAQPATQPVAQPNG
jgi:Domain of unknown function (DUF5666)